MERKMLILLLGKLGRRWSQVCPGPSSLRKKGKVFLKRMRSQKKTAERCGGESPSRELDKAHPQEASDPQRGSGGTKKSLHEAKLLLAVSALDEQVADLSGRLKTLEIDRDAALPRLADAEQRLSQLEAMRFAARDGGAYFEVRDALEQVRRITGEIFSGEIEVVEREDAELAGDRYFTFCVIDSGDVDAILARHHKWHARLCELSPSVRGMFRLSIDARS